jgi:site-specific DNA-methyltransferase (adenine-specific)
MVVAIEDSGFEIRDQIMWIYSSGFPKSHNVSKAIDKAAGAKRKVVGSRPLTGNGKTMRSGFHQPDGTGAGETEKQDVFEFTLPSTPEAQQWEGWGTALKPAHEPIVVARKPLIGTVAQNVLTYGTGAINIDGSRVGFVSDEDESNAKPQGKTLKHAGWNEQSWLEETKPANPQGRWPANVIHDGSDEVLDGFPNTAPSKKTLMGSMTTEGSHEGWKRESHKGFKSVRGYDDLGGSAARFFANLPIDEEDARSFIYCTKASKSERNAGLEGLPTKFAPTMGNGIGGKEHDPETATPKQNFHPTVKPLALMRHLVKLVTPPNGVVLDPFLGSGSTAVAAILEGLDWIGCEMTEDYWPIIEARVEWAHNQPKTLL